MCRQICAQLALPNERNLGFEGYTRATKMRLKRYDTVMSPSSLANALNAFREVSAIALSPLYLGPGKLRELIEDVDFYKMGPGAAFVRLFNLLSLVQQKGVSLHFYKEDIRLKLPGAVIVFTSSTGTEVSVVIRGESFEKIAHANYSGFHEPENLDFYQLLTAQRLLTGRVEEPQEENRLVQAEAIKARLSKL